MLKNIWRTTYRTLVRNKMYTMVNIVGLTIGIAAFILISAYVNFEKSYDRMFRDADNVYRVESSFYKGDHLTDSWPTSTNGYATAMEANFPEIASIVRINWNSSERVVRHGDIKYREEHVCFADTNFFTFFGYRLLQGDPKSVLRDFNTVAISQSAAQKYFGKANPVGKFLELTNTGSTMHCMVTGVFADVPKNSTMQFNFLVSWSSSPLWIRDFWYMHESYTFLKLRPGASPRAVEAKFPALAERYKTGPALKDLKWAITLVPLTEIHLNPAKPYEIEAKGNRVAVKFMSIIAYVILLIACVNYINLSTAKAIERIREVGIRKVNGASSGHLLLQFLLESFVLIGMALLLAAAPTIVAANLNLSFGLLFDTPLYLRVAGVFTGSILISGIYPALLLSRLNPANVLKGRYSFSKSGNLLRKALVGFQFAASVILIAGTFAVYRQLVYMNRQPLGTDIGHTIVLKAPVKTPAYADKIQSFKQVLTRIPGVTGVTVSGAIPGKEVGAFAANRRYGADKSEEHLYEMLRVDHDYISTYHLQLVAGHAFDKSRPSDSTGVILNESAVKQFGFASNEAAVGGRIWLESKLTQPDVVIGVIKDYHQQSLQQQYTPLVLLMDPALGWVPVNYYSVKFSGGNTDAIVAGISNTWKNYFPESSLDWFFLDDFYNRQYRQDIRFGRMFMLFSSLAIFVACMGLFGLTAYSTSRRVKEIGIRKVLGAPVRAIIGMLTMDAIKLVLLSGLVALPLAWFFIEQWLQAYAFRVALTWWQFVIPLALLVLISVGTIGYITFKAAVANPVGSLRDE